MPSDCKAAAIQSNTKINKRNTVHDQKKRKKEKKKKKKRRKKKEGKKKFQSSQANIGIT